MQIRHILAISALSLFTSCYQFEITAQAGFSQLSLDGDLGYVTGTGSAAIQEDLQSGFGLGDDQGTPYFRAGIDFGTPNLKVSGFMFEDDGRGVLNSDFGGVTSGLPVLTDFELSSAKVSYTFDIPMGPVLFAPGLAVNFIDLSILVRDTIGVASEDVQMQAPLPMGYARLEIDFGMVTLIGEGGYISIDVEDVEAKMLDLEAILELTALEPFSLFVGYRKIEFEGQGMVDGDNIDIDIGLSGLMVGGGVVF